VSDEREAVIRRLRSLQGLGRLVGDSRRFRDAVAPLPLIAQSEASVLIVGETGTGKELVARAIHYLSDRTAHPFVAVNCGALTDTLLEDELFGHERGAFTNATHRRAGLLEHADAGTLFLDEVDTLSARAQVALLRVLQEKRFRPLGSSAERRADVRFLAAANAPLFDLVGQGRFRDDLYYRLCVFSVTLPSLRERPDDVLPLSAHFLGLHAPKGKRGLALSAGAAAALLAHPWPGNVRELENVMTRAARLCEGDTVEVVHLGLPGGLPGAATSPAGESGPRAVVPGPYRAQKQLALQAFEHDYLVRLLRASAGNVTRAARLAGKDRRDLGRLLKKHRLDARAFTPRV
jgi:DNA-binding NtrC family response regulator